MCINSLASPSWLRRLHGIMFLFLIFPFSCFLFRLVFSSISTWEAGLDSFGLSFILFLVN